MDSLIMHDPFKNTCNNAELLLAPAPEPVPDKRERESKNI